MNALPRLAIIGAGALTESVYLPVLKENPLFHVACLVDVNNTQASMLAQQYNISKVLSNVNDIPYEEIDAALVVLPNFLHASVTLALLEKGIPVLVEKPMANTSHDCELMNAKAKAKGTQLAVGLVRRFYPTTMFLKEAVQQELFGKLISFDFEEGHVFEWKLQSDYLLSKEKAGGGVLMDTGIHMLDQLIYCIGIPKEVVYYDDNSGGVEADCTLKVTMEKGAKGTLSFSRIRPLRNSIILYFEHARLEVGLNAYSELTIRLNNGITLNSPVVLEGNVFKNKNAFKAQLEDFSQSIISGHACKVSGVEGIQAVQLVERCYASRKSIHEIQTAF